MPIDIPEKQSNTPELACLAAFVRATRDMSDWHDYPLAPTDIKDFLANITSLITHMVSPEEYFYHLGNGAFKECYEAIGQWIIKFASNHNETGAERQVLDAAIEDGVDWAFLPTIFIDLPVQLPAAHLEGGCDYYEYDCTSINCDHVCSQCPYRQKTDTANTFLVTAVLQPRAETCDNHGCVKMPYDRIDYMFNPVKLRSGESVPYDTLYKVDAQVMSWFQDVINVYGDNKFYQLLKFLEKFDLSDLHEHNLGYITTATGSKPILLDWLSREPVPSETCSH